MHEPGLHISDADGRGLLAPTNRLDPQTFHLINSNGLFLFATSLELMESILIHSIRSQYNRLGPESIDSISVHSTRPEASRRRTTRPTFRFLLVEVGLPKPLNDGNCRFLRNCHHFGKCQAPQSNLLNFISHAQKESKASAAQRGSGRSSRTAAVPGTSFWFCCPLSPIVVHWRFCSQFGFIVLDLFCWTARRGCGRGSTSDHGDG